MGLMDDERPELAWIGTESNEFGTDEFLKWCKVVGTEPYFCLNFGTGEFHSHSPHLLRSHTKLMIGTLDEGQ